MRTRRALAILLSTALLLVFSLSRAHGQTPPESPIATDIPDRKATEVCVLGTMHLSGVADRFEPSMVDSLITLLDEHGPDAIGVEGRSGR